MRHSTQEQILASLPPAARRLLPWFISMALGQLLKTAVELELPGTIRPAPVAVADMAEQVGEDPDALRRLLDAPSTFGVFRGTEDGRYAHTELSAVLGHDHGQTLARFYTADWLWQMFGDLTTAMRTGTSPFPQRFGEDIFGYLAEDNPRAATMFNDAMTLLRCSMNHAFVSTIDLDTATTIVNVGGGQGTLIRDLLLNNLRLRGVLFDIEPAIAQAEPELRQAPLSGRCDRVVGNAYESAPQGADVHVLRTVLHMWSDEDCVHVLGNLVEAAASGARALIIEQVRAEQPEGPLPVLLDLLMLLIAGGREWSEAQFAELFQRAGLSQVRTIRTPVMFDIIEARVP